MPLTDFVNRAVDALGRAFGRQADPTPEAPVADPRLLSKSRNVLDGVHQSFGILARPDNIPLETYERMYETDETIGAGIDFLALSVVSQVGDYVNEDHPEAQEFIRSCMQELKGSFNLFLSGLVKSALWSGFAVAEPVYRFDGETIRLHRLEILNPRTVTFEMDLAEGPDRGRLKTVHQWWGTGYQVQMEAEHVVHYAHDQAAAYGNPHGRSLLKRVYKSWFVKDAILKAWALTLERHGTPLPIGKVANGDAEVLLEDGTRTTRRQLMLDVLNDLSNSSALVLDKNGGEEVDLTRVAGSVGDDFLKAQEHLNRMILRGLLMPALVLDNSNTGSYSLGKEHRDIYDLATKALLTEVLETVLEQLVRPLLTWNFGELESWGDFERVNLQADDQKTKAEVYAMAASAGWISPEIPEDLNHVRHDLGFDPREEGLPMMPGSLPKPDPQGLPQEDEPLQEAPPEDLQDAARMAALSAAFRSARR